MKKSNSWIYKIVISAALLAFLFYKINRQELISVLVNVDIVLITFSLAAFFVLYVIKTLKWNILLENFKIKIGFWKRFKLVLIGIFYSIFTPGKAGELARAYYVKEKKAVVFSTVIWDKIIEVFALMVLSLIAITVFLENRFILHMMIMLAILLVVFIFVITNRKVISFTCNFFRIKETDKNEFEKSMLEIAKNKNLISKVFLLNLLFYGVSIYTAAIILYAINSEINLLIAFMLPIIVLFGNIPITVSGLGLREGISVLVFTAFGEKPSIGFSFSLVWFILITLIPGIIGYFITLREK